MRQIRPGLWCFTGLVLGRVYLIEDRDGLTLIDAGIPHAGATILAQIEAMGCRPGDVKRILITHAHPDHIGGLSCLAAATGAQIIASELEKPAIEGRMPMARPARARLTGAARLIAVPKISLPGARVDRVVRDGDMLAEVMGGLQVVFSPGHTPGHLAFWQADRRILFCGDALFNCPNMRPPPSFLTVDEDENRLSIRRLSDLSPAIICFGHGNPLTRNTAQAIATLARRIGAATVATDTMTG